MDSRTGKWPVFGKSSDSDVYNFSTRPGDVRPVRVLISIGLLVMAAFLWVYFQQQNRGSSWLFALLTSSVVFKLLRLLHEWYHYWQVVPPAPPRPVADPTPTWTVDVLTTYCAGEPREMVENTLRAILRMSYPHTTWLCDEANDPALRQLCADLGVRHVTRTDKTDAKAGNINNALRHATGDICLIIDPDHVPVPDFLEQVLPHFGDPAVGFVQCVQGYYNRKESVVAFGASEQTYSFYGPMMTCMGQYGTAQAIGANCTFRRVALDSIGGHANGLSEDMHTAMRLHAGGWTSVYVPLPLSYGLVPATLAGYCKQQLKWARGTFELLVTTYPAVFWRLTTRQKLHYGTLPLYYLLGSVQLIDLLIPILSLLLMQLPLQLDLLLFGTVYIPLVLTGFLVRQYAQRWLIERHEAGFHLVGGVLASGTWWVYVLGLIYTIFRVRVPYIPTPKDDRPRNNFWLVLPNLLMAGLTLAAITYSVYWYGRFALNNVYTQLMIGFGLLNTLILLINCLIGQEKLLLGIANQLRTWSGRRPALAWSVRLSVWNVRYYVYYWLRGMAIPLFGGLMLVSAIAGVAVYQKKNDYLPHQLRFATTQPFYVGLRGGSPVVPNGIGPLIVPHRLRWPVAVGSVPDTLPGPTLPAEIPLLSIEPTGLSANAQEEVSQFLKRVVQGKYNEGLDQFVASAKRYHRPVLVSFLPEFDNPTRSWVRRTEVDLNQYRMAWQYVVRYCRKGGAGNLTWVWCPSQPATLVSGYPGNADVDWLGFSIIDNPVWSDDGKHHSFAALFQLTHTAVRSHLIYTIRQKPILITRLGSVGSVAETRAWTADAVVTIRERYPTIRGVVFDRAADLNRYRADRQSILVSRR